LSKLSLTSKKRSSGFLTLLKAFSRLSDKLSIIEAGPEVADSGDSGGFAKCLCMRMFYATMREEISTLAWIVFPHNHIPIPSIRKSPVAV
jgi:hypothetical protein